MIISALCGKANVYSYRPVDLRIYIKNYAAMVNLLGDNSQIAQLECLRAGIG
jgi:phosphosulfolactate synthase (CoM biosynthesis protein A)